MLNSVYKKATLRLIPLLVVIYLFAYIDRSVVGFAKLQMGADVGISAGVYGLGAGLFFVAYTLFEVPSNLILLKAGPKIWFARIMITWGVITMLMAMTSGPISFYILRFLLGAAEAGFYPGILFLITQWFPATKRARIVGLFLLANPIALAVGGPLSGGLLGLDGVAGLAGWQWLFIVVGAPPVLLAFAVLKWLPNKPSEAKWLTQQEKNLIAEDLRREDIAVGATTVAHPLHALKNPKVLILAAFFLTYPLTGYGLSLWLPTIIKNFGVSDVTTGWLSTLPWIAATIALLVIPRRAERRNSPFAHIAWTLGLAAAALGGSALLQQPWMQLVALCVAAFAIFAGQPIFWSLPSRVLTGGGAAAGLAFINSVGSIGGFVGPYGVGAVTDATGSTQSGLFFLAIFAVYGMLMLIPVRRMILAQAKGPAATDPSAVRKEMATRTPKDSPSAP